ATPSVGCWPSSPPRNCCRLRQRRRMKRLKRATTKRWSPSRTMTDTGLAAWLKRLEALHPREIDLGLERVGEVAHRLGLLPVTVPVVTIAGTNGKGSTA